MNPVIDEKEESKKESTLNLPFFRQQIDNFNNLIEETQNQSKKEQQDEQQEIRDPNAVKITLKQIFDSNVKVNKIQSIQHLKEDENEQYEEMVMIKKQTYFYVERDKVEKIPLLSNNYSEDDDEVQIIVLCSNDIPVPEAEDFYNLITYYHVKDSEEYLKIIQVSKNRKLKLDLLKFIPQINRDFLYPENSEFFLVSQHLNLLREYIMYMKGVIDKYSNPDIQNLIQGLDQFGLDLSDKKYLLFNHPDYQLRIENSIFQESLFEIYRKKVLQLRPETKFQYMKVLRERSPIVDNMLSVTDYPHYYVLKFDHNGQDVLYAVQNDEHALIDIYSEQSGSQIKYGEFYVGSVERNYWGTVFTLWDHGLEDSKFDLVPNFFAFKRNKMFEISYDTNIMASAPRKFQAEFYDTEQKEFHKILSQEPIYNEKKQCYQLNFYGRAQKASARNFSVIEPGDDDMIYLLHGKVSKNHFNLDFRHPLNVLQGFGFSLVSISKQWLVA